MREFTHVFGEKYLLEFDSSSTSTTHTDGGEVELLAIPTNQQARLDLVATGDDVEQEKDRLLNCVRIWNPLILFHNRFDI
jgi:hypothetical protein